jgi:hypothetical protein
LNREQVGPQRFNWRREAILPTQALAEAILVAPWLLGLLPGGHTIVPLAAVGACLVLILGTLYATRAMDAVRVPTLVQRALVLIGMVGASAQAMNVAVFTAPPLNDWAWLRAPSGHILDLTRLLPETIIAAMSVAWLCRRGLQLADRLPSIADVARSFQIGVVMLSLLVVMNVERDLTIFIPAYFFCQLLAVSLTRVEMIARERGGRVDRGASGWWVSTLVSSTGIVVLLASLISAFILGIGPDELLLRLWPLLSIIAAPVVLIFFSFVAVLGMILEIILRPLQNWLATVAIQFSNLSSGLDNPAEKIKQTDTRFYTGQYVEVIAVILLVLGVLAAVAWGMRRRRLDEGEDELHESVWSGSALLLKLGRQLQNRLAQLRHLADLAGHFGASGLFAALTIRRIYAQTVKLAASRGYPRPAAHTPYEHLAALGQAFPGCESDLSRLTEAYVGVHYGELPERAEALADIRAAFDRIKMAEKPVGAGI